MEPDETSTDCILRRMKRKSFSGWAWNVYNPTKALPEELRFDLLDGHGRNIGQITYTKITLLKGSEMTTPWGAARIDVGMKGTRVFLGDRELAQFGGHLLKKEMELVFPSGQRMPFTPKKGYKNDIEYSDGKGFIGVYEEKGTLPEGDPGMKPQMTKEDVKMLPKDQRPHSIETRDYVQYSIKSWGTMPVKKEDLIAALAIFASFGCIVGEIPS
jgi:hypothetical protein